MSDKHPSGSREISNATPELMRKELEKYVHHMLDHDPKRLEFALMVTGHSEESGGTHVCSMIGGHPQAIAQTIIDLMNDLVKRDPMFAVFFLINIMQHMPGNQDMSKFDFDNTGGADVEAQVKNLLDKLRNDTPPNGSIH